MPDPRSDIPLWDDNLIDSSPRGLIKTYVMIGYDDDNIVKAITGRSTMPEDAVRDLLAAVKEQTLSLEEEAQ